MSKKTTNGSSSIGKGGAAVERQLPCELTDEELLARGDSMAAAELQIDALKADRRAVNKQINEQIDLRNKLAHAIESGEEMRDVHCQWKASESEKLWRLYRDDTGEQIEDRPMNAADLQGSLSFPSDDEDDVRVTVAAAAAGETELQEQIAAADKKLTGTKPKPKPVKPATKSKSKGKSKSTRAHA